MECAIFENDALSPAEPLHITASATLCSRYPRTNRWKLVTDPGGSRRSSSSLFPDFCPSFNHSARALNDCSETSDSSPTVTATLRKAMELGDDAALERAWSTNQKRKPHSCRRRSCQSSSSLLPLHILKHPDFASSWGAKSGLSGVKSQGLSAQERSVCGKDIA